ncbi:MAG TPA: helix-turn-helix domain-containing protein [Ktedonobacteraceae bacterium]|nr:helix-turn-helix domain-containing protein [Ktedonobacteraceae bacterium]
MGKKQTHPLRAFTLQEEQALRRITKATSERLDVVKRAQALLSVQEGRSFTDAARQAGYKSGDSVVQLVQRFNQRGLLALLIAPERGRKPTYTALERARMVQEVRREPEGRPTTQPHEYVRGGIAKLLTLFRPVTGQVQAKAVSSAPNAVLHLFCLEWQAAAKARACPLASFGWVRSGCHLWLLNC